MALRDAIAGERWFAGKGRAISGLRPVREQDVPGEPSLTVTVVEVIYDDGGRDAYNLLLHDGHDALDQSEVALRLLEVMAAEERHGSLHGYRLARFDVRGDPRPVGAEQSNSSVVFGDALLLKWFRRATAGVQPELEMTLALTAAGFPHVPRPLAAIDWEGQTALALLQEFLADAEDGWQVALRSAQQSLEPDDRGAAGVFTAVARQLGEVTGEMHRSLASIDDEGFGGRDVMPGDLASWEAAIVDELDAVLGLPGAPADLASLRPQIVERLAGIRAVDDAGKVCRVHGDYHLGQVLRYQDGWVVLDFEGEPSRPLEERRDLRSPLVDVAGMLRSFEYAAQSALRAVDPSDPADQDRAEEWARRQREAFLAGYRAAVDGTGLIAGGDAFDRLLEVFELRKAIYEVGYELSHRPDWVDIPARAVARLAGA